MITYIIRLLCLLLHPSTCLRQGGQARGFPRQVPCPGHRLLLLHVVRFIRSHGVGVCIALHLLFFIQTSATQHGCVRACATSSAGTSSTSYSTSSTRRSTTTSPTHSKSNTLAFTCLTQNQPLHLVITQTSTASCSFVSLIHLVVGVIYCLISWSVGLPKRAVISAYNLIHHRL